MANRAYLFRRDNDQLGDLKEDDVIAASNYSIPLFWLSLFSQDSFYNAKEEFDDGSIADCPCLFIDLNNAMENLQKRKNNILTIISKEFEELLQQFYIYIGSFKSKYLHLYLTEITVMSSDYELFKANLKLLIDALDNMRISELKTLFQEIVGLEWVDGKEISMDPNSKPVIYKLCGYGWNNKVPWDIKS